METKKRVRERKITIVLDEKRGNEKKKIERNK